MWFFFCLLLLDENHPDLHTSIVPPQCFEGSVFQWVEFDQIVSQWSLTAERILLRKYSRLLLFTVCLLWRGWTEKKKEAVDQKWLKWMCWSDVGPQTGYDGMLLFKGLHQCSVKKQWKTAVRTKGSLTEVRVMYKQSRAGRIIILVFPKAFVANTGSFVKQKQPKMTLCRSLY